MSEQLSEFVKLVKRMREHQIRTWCSHAASSKTDAELAVDTWLTAWDQQEEVRAEPLANASISTMYKIGPQRAAPKSAAAINAEVKQVREAGESAEWLARIQERMEKYTTPGTAEYDGIRNIIR